MILVLFLKPICFTCPLRIHASVDLHSVPCYEGQRRDRLAQLKERIVVPPTVPPNDQAAASSPPSPTIPCHISNHQSHRPHVHLEEEWTLEPQAPLTMSGGRTG